MNCSDWQDVMLEAEPAELSGEGESALAKHLRSCAVCRAQADLLLRAMTELDQDLAAEAARDQVRRLGRPERLRRAALVAVPLAAAAAIALLLLGPFRAGRGPGLVRIPPVPTVAAVPVVTPPPGRNAAVIQTDNPDIVIVWLY